MRTEDQLNVHGLADGSLAGAEAEETRRLIHESEELRAEYEAVVVVRSTLMRCCEPAADADLWKQCRRRLDEVERVARSEAFFGRYAWGLCGLFVALIVGASIFNRQIDDRKLYTADMAHLVSSLTPVQTPAVKGGDEWRGWVEGHVGRASANLAIPQVVVLGARQGIVDGRRALEFHLGDAKGKLSFLIVEGTDSIYGFAAESHGSVYHVGRLQGTNCISWTEGRHAFLLSGERPFSSLRATADVLRDGPGAP